jgi:hypothetical protein
MKNANFEGAESEMSTNFLLLRHLLKELNPRRRVYVVICRFDVILATPKRVLVSQHRPDAEGLISILKCLKLAIDIIFQCHFIAHLARSNANVLVIIPYTGTCTNSTSIKFYIQL